MRRAVITLASTAAGIAALLSYKTHSAPAVAAGPPSSVPSSVPSAAMSATPSAKATAGGAAPAGSATKTRTITGTVANTQYGPMQVQLTLTGTKITKATVLQRTDSGAESDEIDSFAIPKLTSETVTAQSASIDAVSGASYTSSGYIKSLQSAVDQARA